MPPSFDWELKFGAPHKLVAGIDEVGRGALAGDLVAAAVILPHDHNIIGIDDSKKLSEKKRLEIFDRLIEIADIGIGVASAAEIDEFGIVKANFLAMTRAANRLNKTPNAVLVDGKYVPDELALKFETCSIIRGDSISLSIAAASIIAKTTRDKVMRRLAEQFPHYGWHSNVGYGAPKHIEAIKKYGATPQHRLSFAPLSGF